MENENSSNRMILLLVLLMALMLLTVIVENMKPRFIMTGDCEGCKKKAPAKGTRK